MLFYLFMLPILNIAHSHRPFMIYIQNISQPLKFSCHSYISCKWRHWSVIIWKPGWWWWWWWWWWCRSRQEASFFPTSWKTNRRRDAVLVSQQSKTLVAIELTVPWEESCEGAHERKNLKYADLIVDCKNKGSSVWLFPVEVGCRGFPAQSVWKLLTRLGCH